MRRYRLSQIFTANVERFMPKTSFFGTSAKENMEISRNFYRDTLIKDLQTLFGTFDTKLKMETEKTGIGKATIRIQAVGQYIGLAPREFKLSTECSDLMLAMGREAAFCIEHGDQKEIIYYGNSIHPDNDSQFLGMPDHIGDLQKILHHLHRASFNSLYAEAYPQPSIQP